MNTGKPNFPHEFTPLKPPLVFELTMRLNHRNMSGLWNWLIVVFNKARSDFCNGKIGLYRNVYADIISVSSRFKSNSCGDEVIIGMFCINPLGKINVHLIACL